MELKVDSKNNESNKLIIYHLNIMSLNKTRDELSIVTRLNLIRLHLICLSEHHMREQEITNLSLSNYRLLSSFCRVGFKGIYVF